MSGIELSRALVLEAPVAVPDGAGGFRVEWTALGTLWADVRPRGARREVVAGEVRPQNSYRIIVRAAPDGAPSRPRAEQRLREGERVFDIVTVMERDARYLEVTAEERSGS